MLINMYNFLVHKTSKLQGVAVEIFKVLFLGWEKFFFSHICLSYGDKINTVTFDNIFQTISQALLPESSRQKNEKYQRSRCACATAKTVNAVSYMYMQGP